MTKKKVCTQCRLLVVGEICDNCKGNQFSLNWQGRIFISNPEKSIVAQKMGIAAKGEYGIKVK